MAPKPGYHHPPPEKLLRPTRKDRQRVAAVRTLVARLWSTQRIAYALAEQWKISEAAVRKYVEHVYAEMREERARREQDRLPRIINALENAYEDARRAGDNKAAISALGHLGRMEAPTRVHLTGEVNATIATVDVKNPDAVRARIAELMAKHGKPPTGEDEK